MSYKIIGNMITDVQVFGWASGSLSVVGPLFVGMSSVNTYIIFENFRLFQSFVALILCDVPSVIHVIY